MLVLALDLKMETAVKSVLTVPLITDNLAVATIQLCMRNSSHLSSLDIADMAQDIGSDTIEALIGSDYYWQLVSGRVVRYDGL